MFKGFNLFGNKPRASKVEVRDYDLPPTIEQRRAENEYIADRALKSVKKKLEAGIITPEEYAILTDPTRKSSIPLSLGRANREARLAGGKRRRRTQRRKAKKANKTYKRNGRKAHKTHRRKGTKVRRARKSQRRRR